jgi:hypothetical protein
MLIVNNEFERMWKVVVLAYIKKVSLLCMEGQRRTKYIQVLSATSRTRVGKRIILNTVAYRPVAGN